MKKTIKRSDFPFPVSSLDPLLLKEPKASCCSPEAGGEEEGNCCPETEDGTPCCNC